MLAAGASAGLAAAGSAAPAPLLPDLECDPPPQIWEEACHDGANAATGAFSSVHNARPANADEAFVAADRLAADAAFACARADRWRDADALVDLVAEVAGARAATLGQYSDGKGASPVCAHAADVRAEDVALVAALESARRAAAREYFESLAVESVLTLPGAQSRRTQGVAERRCAWLAEAGRRRAHDGVTSLSEENLSAGLLALSSALGAYDEAKAVCPGAAREAIDARRAVIADLIVAGMERGAAASREAREVGLTLFEEGGGGLPEFIRLQAVDEDRELFAQAGADRVDIAARQALRGADGGGRLARERLAAPVDLVREARLREDAGH
jgi:hypothetical protein